MLYQSVISFIICFILGYAVSMLWNSNYDKIPISVSPTPWNTDTLYMDRAGVCYKYEALRRPCPSYDLAQKIHLS